MKILLATPLSVTSSIKWIPVGLAYIASNLKKHGHEVRLFDRFLQNQKHKNTTIVNEHMKSTIIEFKPDIIGFSTTSPTIFDTVDTVRYIRNFYDGIIVAGGHHATAMPELTLKKIPGLSYIVAGEGEIPMTELADGKPPEDIPGIFTRNTNPLKFTKARSSVLDSLPQPDYSIFDMAHYTSLGCGSVRGIYLNSADIVSSRGCSNNCVFCSETLTYGKGVRFHSAGYVADNVESLIEKYGINGLYFHDNDFLISKDHATGICKEFIKRGINKKVKWAVQSGTNRIDNEILQLMSQAGCVKIEFGMESVNPDHLTGIRKNRSVEMSERAIKLCRENNILVHSYFMTGFKGETLKDLNTLIKWIKLQKPHTFQLGLTKIYPGTPLYDSFGSNFYENTPWTEYNLNNYYIKDFFSDIEPAERFKWNKKVYGPFSRNYFKKTLIKSNSMSILLKRFTSSR